MMKTTSFVVAVCLGASLVSPAVSVRAGNDLFAHENLVPWCIVPFDANKRGP